MNNLFTMHLQPAECDKGSNNTGFQAHCRYIWKDMLVYLLRKTIFDFINGPIAVFTTDILTKRRHFHLWNVKVHPWNVKDKLEVLDPKTSISGNVPIRIRKDSKNIIVQFLTDCINVAINNCCFPNELKVTDVSPCYKKGIKTEKSNYWLVSALPAISKIFERLIGSQISHFLENKWSNLLTAFTKGHSTQDALLRVNLGASALMPQTLLGQY